MLMLTESTLHFINLTRGLRNKKFNLAGKVDHWRGLVDPNSKPKPSSTAVPSTTSGTSARKSTSLKSSQVTPVTAATEPPLTVADNRSETSSDVDENCKDHDDDSQEQSVALASGRQGKAVMQVSHDTSCKV